MPNKLKPCPFCGSKKLCASFDDYNNSIVYCRECGAEGPKIDRGPCYKDEAIEAWNRRAYDPEECKNCKREKHLVGITRAEAVERMAKALLLKMFKGIVDWEKLDDKEKVRWRKSAEAALAALLEEVR